MDLGYVRCPKRIFEMARGTEATSKVLASGVAPFPLEPNEAIEEIDLGRAQQSIYQMMGGEGPYWDLVSPPDWRQLALLGDEDFPFGCDPNIYGPSRFLTSVSVRNLATMFEPYTPALLNTSVDDRDYLLPHFVSLRRFYLEAARSEQVVIITPE